MGYDIFIAGGKLCHFVSDATHTTEYAVGNDTGPGKYAGMEHRMKSVTCRAKAYGLSNPLAVRNVRRHGCLRGLNGRACQGSDDTAGIRRNLLSGTDMIRSKPHPVPKGAEKRITVVSCRSRCRRKAVKAVGEYKPKARYELTDFHTGALNEFEPQAMNEFSAVGGGM